MKRAPARAEVAQEASTRPRPAEAGSKAGNASDVPDPFKPRSVTRAGRWFNALTALVYVVYVATRSSLSEALGWCLVLGATLVDARVRNRRPHPVGFREGGGVRVGFRPEVRRSLLVGVAAVVALVGAEEAWSFHGRTFIPMRTLMTLLVLSPTLLRLGGSVLVTETGLEQRFLGRRRARLAWQEVAEIRFDVQANAFVVSAGGIRIALHRTLDGLGDFAAQALASAPASALDIQPGMRARLEAMVARRGGERRMVTESEPVLG